MKKYLMTGMAALAISAAFTSCSKDTDVYNSGVIENNDKQSIINNYNEAFVKTFGQPAANHNWGFVNYAKSNTRATGAFADHVGAYPDANNWTRDGFLAPDPLTQSQKLRAQYYFQMNKIENPNRPDYGTKDFFVQQVYDGGTDPMTGKSAEKYLAANGSTLIESGEHMDHLTAGPNHLHIYNFNNGTCSTNGNVANRDQTDVNNASQQHSDEIQLMLNTPTSCFGYANSDASCVRDDRWTLVSAATIDNFCDNDPGFSAWLGERLTDERGDVKCVDDFNRDYIGFDFDMIPDDLCYAYNGYDQNGNQTWDPNQVKSKEFIYAQYGTLNEANDSRVFNEDGTVSTYASWNTEIIIDNKGIPYVVTNTNMYCAIGDNANIGIGGMDGFNDYATIGHYVEGGANDNTLYLDNLPNEQSDKKAINMKFIAKLVREGYLPVAGKDLKRWVKIGGCNDGYFSDWIVTFMPADAGENPEYSLRVICEDLNAQAGEGDPEDSDWDFNDLVFDVKFLGGDDVQIQVVAVGGTLPIRINGEDALEAHGLYDQGTNIMINTGAGAKYPSQAYESNGIPAKAIFTRNIPGVNNTYGKNIKVEVKKGDQWIELTAEADQPAAKIGVEPTFDYCTERVDISGRYTNFISWIRTKNPARWWNE